MTTICNCGWCEMSNRQQENEITFLFVEKWFDILAVKEWSYGPNLSKNHGPGRAFVIQKFAIGSLWIVRPYPYKNG
jgi:hypothetical protein